MDTLIAMAVDATGKFGGTTFGIDKLGPESGYMVGMFGHEKKVDSKDFNESVLKAYVQSKEAILKGFSNLYIGTWVNELGEVVMDLSYNILDLRSALIMGTSGKQDAIYNVETKEVIHLKK